MFLVEECFILTNHKTKILFVSMVHVCTACRRNKHIRLFLKLTDARNV